MVGPSETISFQCSRQRLPGQQYLTPWQPPRAIRFTHAMCYLLPTCLHLLRVEELYGTLRTARTLFGAMSQDPPVSGWPVNPLWVQTQPTLCREGCRGSAEVGKVAEGRWGGQAGEGFHLQKSGWAGGTWLSLQAPSPDQSQSLWGSGHSHAQGLCFRRSRAPQRIGTFGKWYG